MSRDHWDKVVKDCVAILSGGETYTLFTAEDAIDEAVSREMIRECFQAE